MAQLNAWKAAYAEEHGKAPTKKAILRDDGIRAVYDEYEALGGGKKRKKQVQAQPQPQPQPPAPSPQEGNEGDGGGPHEEPSASETAKRERKAVAARKKAVVAQLNAWKAAYTEEHGEAPTKKQLRTDPSIRTLYEEYVEIGSVQKKMKEAGTTGETAEDVDA